MPINTFNPQQILAMLNRLETEIMSNRIFPGAGVQILKNQSGYLISANPGTGGKQNNYTGMFKVTLESGTLMVRNGADPDFEPAGFLYYNQIPFLAPSGSAAAAEGYLCVSCNSEGEIAYVVEPTIPPLPILTSPEEDDTAKFPLAKITKTGESFTVEQICRYFPPYLPVWGPCDTKSTETTE